MYSSVTYMYKYVKLLVRESLVLAMTVDGLLA
jgi:hypothetical protein